MVMFGKKQTQYGHHSEMKDAHGEYIYIYNTYYGYMSQTHGGSCMYNLLWLNTGHLSLNIITCRLPMNQHQVQRQMDLNGHPSAPQK